MKELSNEQKKKIIINIISDGVIMERTRRGMNEILKSFNPSDDGWEAEENYHGIVTCFPILGFDDSYENEMYTDEMCGQFVDAVNLDFGKTINERLRADELAYCIYNKWLEVKRKFEFDKFKAA